MTDLERALRSAIVSGGSASFATALAACPDSDLDPSGAALLGLALARGRLGMAERLRRRGVSARSPLHWAAFLGGSRATPRGWAWMRRFGAPLWAPLPGSGLTPLHLVARWQSHRRDWALECLAGGGSWQAPARDGTTAWALLPEESRHGWPGC